MGIETDVLSLTETRTCIQVETPIVCARRYWTKQRRCTRILERWLSAIIPTYREACGIADAVAAAGAVADEVIVVDSGSNDGTAEIAARAGAKLVHAPRGRGVQLGTGATAARGKVLLFLHADARLGAGARFAIHRALSNPRVVGGNFRLRFDSGTPAACLFSVANDLRRRWLHIYYGDSAIFVRKDIYERLGGFRPIPLFEDYDLVRRLERAGQAISQCLWR